MKNLIRNFKYSMPIALFFLFAILLFVTLPTYIIEALIVIDWCLAVGILFMLFSKEKYSKTFSSMVSLFSTITVGSVIASTRTFLTIETYEEQLPIARVLGEWICEENYIAGSCFTIIFGIELIMFCIFFVSSKTEKLSIASADNRPVLNVLKIKQALARGEITKDEADLQILENQKKHVEFEKQNGFFLQLMYLGQYYTGVLKAFIVFFIIDIAGGIAVGILTRELYWKDALQEYATLACGYISIYLLPLTLVTICYYIWIRKERKNITK